MATDSHQDRLQDLLQSGEAVPEKCNPTEKYTEDMKVVPSKAVFVVQQPSGIPANSIGVLAPIVAEPKPTKPLAKKKLIKSPKQPLPATLPQARIRTIMKTTPNVSFLSQETVALTTKAAELFIRKMAKLCHDKERQDSKEEFKYNDLAKIVKASSELGFLKDFIPCTVTVREYQKMYQLEPRTTGSTVNRSPGSTGTTVST